MISGHIYAFNLKNGTTQNTWRTGWGQLPTDLIQENLRWSKHQTHAYTDSIQHKREPRRSNTGLIHTLALCLSSTQKIAYETSIQSSLKSASAIWSPHQASLIIILESTENFAARLIASGYSCQESVRVIESSLRLKPLVLRLKIAELSSPTAMTRRNYVGNVLSCHPLIYPFFT